ncbi:MAG: prolyl oligopeptidase family serine peptidase [Burkholderiales bacterium]|nr:prolyl oligopeptidase family serine peptidase [Burkholderiales bacterium]
MKHLHMFAVAAAIFTTLMNSAAAQAVDRTLNETVQMVTLPGTSTALETTIYRPDGDGPFPVAVINHARHSGEPKDQERFRPATAARYFLQRGYAVVVPMRQGLSRSGGWYVGRGCDVERNARSQAEDVAGVLTALSTSSWFDKSRIVTVGHSHGGVTSLALGAAAYPGLRGVVNFAGGTRNSECPVWQYDLTQAVAKMAKQTPAPSLWIYGDNDSFFGDVYRSMHAQYRAAGGNATLVTVNDFGPDSHQLFISKAGAPLWHPSVSEFLRTLGLPYEPLAQYAKYGKEEDSPRASGFASLGDVDRVPNLRMFGRSAYRKFLEIATPRAFAVGPDGAYGWANGENASDRALEYCFKNNKGACKLYAVDSEVVWRD